MNGIEAIIILTLMAVGLAAIRRAPKEIIALAWVAVALISFGIGWRLG